MNQCVLMDFLTNQYKNALHRSELAEARRYAGEMVNHMERCPVCSGALYVQLWPNAIVGNDMQQQESQ